MTTQATRGQEIALMVLRFTIGMLLVWWGLAKIVNPGMGVMISNKFYLGAFSVGELQYYFGYVQILVGSCVALGFMRRFAVPAQLLITGTSALAIWNALLDPFGLWLPVDKVAPIQHLFYPTACILAGSVVMIMFRAHDRLNVDRLIAAWRARSVKDQVTTAAL